jgi:hypothetical protein
MFKREKSGSSEASKIVPKHRGISIRGEDFYLLAPTGEDLKNNA